jgi:hypothetical protein
MNERTATINDTPMRWLEQDGEGVPIVLVHGIPTSPAGGGTSSRGCARTGSSHSR